MRSRSAFRLCLLLLAISLAVPHLAHAQSAQGGKRDRLWNGMLIGAGVGAVAGMLVAPQALCGSNDTECAVIVRAAIGLPAIAGGIGIGALIDGLNSRSPSAQRGFGVRGLQMTVRF